MQLNPETDLNVDVTDLSAEFRSFPTVFFRYYQHKAEIEAKCDIAKAFLKETRARVYKRLKSDVSVKHTEKSLESVIDLDPEVMTAQRNLIKAEHDATTWNGAVESMRAKKDCLIQLSADRRKEMQ